MPLSFDVEFEKVFAPRLAAAAGLEPPRAGDVDARRRRVGAVMDSQAAQQLPAPEVLVTRHDIPVGGPASIEARWYALPGEASKASVLYLHGGGLIMGSLDQYDAFVSRYVADAGIPMLSVGYRHAPEHPHPTPVKDAHVALMWLQSNAGRLGVDPERISVMGDSGGGGIAASLAILTRDRGEIQLQNQILVYPMLDDRNIVPDPRLKGLVTWTYDDNLTGWHAHLEGLGAAERTCPYAVPARVQDFSGLPPAFIDVGELDIFRDESMAFGIGLLAAGVSAEIHVYPGVPHAFTGIAPQIPVSQAAYKARVRRLASLS